MHPTTSPDSAPSVTITSTSGEIVIELFGPVPSKKNRYMPKRNRPGMFKSSALERQLDALMLQIPPECVGLELVHPDIEIFLQCPQFRQDRDNILTTILDVLVNMRVIRNDCIAQLNGTIILHPVRRAKGWKTVIVLRPRFFSRRASSS